MACQPAGPYSADVRFGARLSCRGTERHKAAPKADQATTSNGNGHNGNASSSAKSARQATESQVKAIYAIAKTKGLNLTTLLREHFQVDHPQRLSLKQASSLIDQLKDGRTS